LFFRIYVDGRKLYEIEQQVYEHTKIPQSFLSCSKSHLPSALREIRDRKVIPRMSTENVNQATQPLFIANQKV